MATITENVGTLTIANGTTTSGSLSALLTAGQMKILNSAVTELTIYGPAALTGTVSVQISPTESGASGTFDYLNVAGTRQTVPAADALTVTKTPTFKDLRLFSGSSEGADRVFTILVRLEAGDM